MSREMSAAEIEQFLGEEYVARIGCRSDQGTYVVPVAYAYRDGAVWAFSHEGLKLRLMREDPRVCVEVDRVEHLGSWKSVILHGSFEEVKGKDAETGAELLADRLGGVINDPESRRRLEGALRDDPRPTVFRIVIDKRTGRVEGSSEQPA